MTEVPVYKLKTVDAFIVFDLADAAESVGAVRSARKILPGGASDLARSLTYTFASFEMKRGGAAAGINAVDEERPDALANFTAEIAPMVASGQFLPEPGTRVPRSALASLAKDDPRAAIGEAAEQALVAGVVAASAQVSGGMDGRTVTIEGFGATGPALAAVVVEQGGKVVAVTAGNKGFVDQGGLSVERLSAPGTIPEGEVSTAEALSAAEALSEPVDIMLVGSKMGAINHELAAQIEVGTLVPYGPIPITARALAVLSQAGTQVVPDFISTAGPLFAWWPSDEQATPSVEAAAQITAAAEEIGGHSDGMFLAAAQRAEAFLSTWQETLPFGRPLAS